MNRRPNVILVFRFSTNLVPLKSEFFQTYVGCFDQLPWSDDVAPTELWPAAKFPHKSRCEKILGRGMNCTFQQGGVTLRRQTSKKFTFWKQHKKCPIFAWNPTVPTGWNKFISCFLPRLSVFVEELTSVSGTNVVHWCRHIQSMASQARRPPCDKKVSWPPKQTIPGHRTCSCPVHCFTALCFGCFSHRSIWTLQINLSEAWVFFGPPKHWFTQGNMWSDMNWEPWTHLTGLDLGCSLRAAEPWCEDIGLGEGPLHWSSRWLQKPLGDLLGVIPVLLTQKLSILSLTVWWRSTLQSGQHPFWFKKGKTQVMWSPHGGGERDAG